MRERNGKGKGQIGATCKVESIILASDRIQSIRKKKGPKTTKHGRVMFCKNPDFSPGRCGSVGA